MVTRGRPRSFDRDAALRAAMETFWKAGFEGASMAALTEAMGINSPSLYAAFGSKEGLFREAVALYLKTEDCKGRIILEREPTARAAVGAMLRNSVGNLTRAGCPQGCLLILGDSNASPDNDEVRRHLCQRRRDIQAALEQRVRRGISEGDVPAHADAGAMAAFYMTVIQGLSLQARDDASRKALTAIVESAMAAWDSLTQKPNPTPAPTKAGRPAKAIQP